MTRYWRWEIGADDYVVKPFDPKELMARVKAVIRRTNTSQEEKRVIEYDDLMIDMDDYKVVYKGETLKLPPKEMELLYFLATRPNKVFYARTAFGASLGFLTILGIRARWTFISSACGKNCPREVTGRSRPYGASGTNLR